MIFWFTLAVVIFLVLMAVVLNYITLAFYEFQGAFIYTMVGVLIFIIGAAVYLSFAVPSLAGENIPFFGKGKQMTVHQDTVKGMELLEQ